MADWRKLESRFEYEVKIGSDKEELDRVLDLVRQLDPDAWWIRIDGIYVICSNQSQAAISALLVGSETSLKKGK